MEKKAKKFFNDAHLSDYFQYTTETIFDRSIMRHLLSDIIFKHSSFRAFTDSYNYLHCSSLQFRFLLNSKRLADAFYCFELVRFFYENKNIPLQSKIIINNKSKIYSKITFLYIH